MDEPATVSDSIAAVAVVVVVVVVAVVLTGAEELTDRLAEGEQLVPAQLREDAVDEGVDCSMSEDVDDGGGDDEDEDEDVYLWDISSSFT